MSKSSDPAAAREIARAFVRNVADGPGLRGRTVATLLQEIDRRNKAETNPSICHSHDFCDANECMEEAIQRITGRDLPSELPFVSDHTRGLWDTAWKIARVEGFVNLYITPGAPDDAVLRLSTTRHESHTLNAHVVGMFEGPIKPMIGWDFWGRTPLLQAICFDASELGGEEGNVVVRYNTDGRISEVFIHDPDVAVYRPTDGIRNSPWELLRESNPPGRAGDEFMCASGLRGRVSRLRERYDSFEEFKAYAETYGLLARLHEWSQLTPEEGAIPRYRTLQDAWAANPLVVSTTDPADFSIVPEIEPTVPTGCPNTINGTITIPLTPPCPPNPLPHLQASAPFAPQG